MWVDTVYSVGIGIIKQTHVVAVLLPFKKINK